MSILDRMRQSRLTTFKVEVGDVRLDIQAADDLTDEARAAALRHWEQLESYVVRHPDFRGAYVPMPVDDDAPPIVRAMAVASNIAQVGPMVTLPGALCEAVARDLTAFSKEVLVACEGDSFVIGGRGRTFLVEAAGRPGDSGIGVRVRSKGPFAFFSSLGRVRVDPAIGHARAVAVLADHGAVADATGSAMGSAMMRPSQIDRALSIARQMPGVRGAVILSQGRIGVWGQFELVTPSPKQG